MAAVYVSGVLERCIVVCLPRELLEVFNPLRKLPWQQLGWFIFLKDFMFYHVSKIDLGFIGIFEPRVPESSLPSKEGNIPRVCVAPSIRDCLLSINGGGDFNIRDMLLNLTVNEYLDADLFRPEMTVGPIAVYVTHEEPFLPPDASDFREYKEHWFIKKVVLQRLGYLDLALLSKGEIAVVQESNRLENINKNTLVGDML